MKEFICSTICSVYDDFSALILLILDLPVVFTIYHSLLPEPRFALVSWTAFSLGSPSTSLSVPLSIFCRFLLSPLNRSWELSHHSSSLSTLAPWVTPQSHDFKCCLYTVGFWSVASSLGLTLDLIFSPTSFSTVPPSHSPAIAMLAFLFLVIVLPPEFSGPGLA